MSSTIWGRVRVLALALALAPLPASAAGEAIDWTTASAGLRAAALTVSIGELRLPAASGAHLHSDPGTPTYRTLEAEWTDEAGRYRIYVYFGADEAWWWVDGISVRGGPAGEVRAAFAGPLFRTRRGERWQGDVTLVVERDGTVARLEARELDLVAFLPGTGPGPMVGCTHATPASRAEPLDPGEPLAGLGLVGRPPAEAEAIVHGAGLCFTFRYGYPLHDGGGYSERWCTAPPRGRVTGLGYLDDGEVVLFVEDERPRHAREQPPEGWGCPAA